jgi:hypothetical protein
MNKSTTKGHNMKNPHTWRLDWKQDEAFEGVTQAWHAQGDMYLLEVQEQDNDTVVGTVWRRIPATFWEPEDVACVLEQTYESVGAAKFLLEKLDADELQAEQENEARLEQSMLEA